MSTRTLVMAVPWDEQRATVARMLAERADAEIVWDQTRNAYDTWQAMLATAGDDPAVFLEDDVILAADWRSKVEAVIAERPDDVIQFFSIRDEYEPGYRGGSTYLMNQCFYLPGGVAADLLAFSRDWRDSHPEHPTGTDTTTADFLRSTKRDYWMHVPSLVQHREWRSVIDPRRSSRRQSKVFDA